MVTDEDNECHHPCSFRDRPQRRLRMQTKLDNITANCKEEDLEANREPVCPE